MIIMNSKTIVIGLMMLFSLSLFGQVGIGTNEISTKAMLQIESKKGEEYKGFMPPKVPNDAAKASIAPAPEDKGLVIYVEETQSLEVWNGTNWQQTHKNTSSAYAKDLFISEYVEGSSNNKAIEIANFTGRSINLGDYALLDNSNGGGTGTGSGNATGRLGGLGGSVINLNSVILNHGEVYVVAGTTNLPGRTDLGDLADQSSASLTFNGDDAVILMKNNGNTVVDVIGIPFLQWKYGEDVTLRRKPGYGPSTVYIPGQFEVKPIDTFNGLGSHTF